jgi:hypothetical protein
MEVRFYTLLITFTAACTKPSKLSNIEFRTEMTIHVATPLLLF